MQGVATAANAEGVETLAVVGSVEPGHASLSTGGLALAAVATLVPPHNIAEAMTRAPELIEEATSQRLASYLGKLP